MGGEVADEFVPGAGGARLPATLHPIRLLREGRRSSVLLANNAAGEAVAVKVTASSDHHGELDRERRALRAIQHPRVAQLMEPPGDAGACLATRFTAGRSLQELVREHGHAPEAWVIEATRQLLSALGAVHAAGIVHGDVSLANCISAGTESFATPPDVTLVDFGSSRFIADPAPAALGVSATPTTMAPELAHAAPSVPSDLYAVACVAYELAVGVPPFQASTSTEMLWQHTHQPARPLRSMSPSSTIGTRLDAVILKGLSKDPAARYPSAEAFGEALAFATTRPDEGAEPSVRVPRDVAHAALRALLVARVRSVWIDAVLDRTTEGVILVRQDLRTADAPDADGAAARPVADARGVVGAFQRNAALLLLGDAGHGKTVNLLRLARLLAARAESDPMAPLPVVIAVSSWKRQPRLRDWMVDELVSKYGLLRSEARELVASDAVVPLLDGLDDLPIGPRADVARLIEAHRQASPHLPIVVSCRTGEYQDLGVRISMATVELEGLRQEDVLKQLRASGQTSLVQVLEGSASLTSVVSTPMFLHLMRVSHRDSERFRASLDSEVTTKAALFDAFIDVAYRRSGRSDADRAALDTSLKRLANLLRTAGRTMVFFEEIQPSWLSSAHARAAYVVLSRCLVALIFCASTIPAIAFDPLDNDGLLPSGAFATRLAAFGFLALAAGFTGLALLRFRRRERRTAAGSVVISLLAGAAMGAVIAGLGYPFEPHPIAALLGIELGIVGALVMGVSRRKRQGLDDDVLAAEEMRWSIRAVRPPYFIGLLVATAVLVLIGATVNKSIVAGIYTGGAIFLVGTVLLGYTAKKGEHRMAPNAGMRTTLKNALWASLFAFIPTTALFALSYGVYGACVGLTLGTVVLLWFGGIDVIQHAVLRLLLHRSGQLPVGVNQRLDAAVDAGLLRRVGNGYMFMHSLLLDHLADRSDGNDSNDGDDARAVSETTE